MKFFSYKVHAKNILALVLAWGVLPIAIGGLGYSLDSIFFFPFAEYGEYGLSVMISVYFSVVVFGVGIFLLWKKHVNHAIAMIVIPFIFAFNWMSFVVFSVLFPELSFLAAYILIWAMLIIIILLAYTIWWLLVSNP